MKKSMILVMAAAAAAMTLVSCNKELQNEGTITKDGLRTLTVGFADSNTRTAPTTIEGGIQPVWASGDQITISNGSSTEEVTVPVEAVGKSSFTVTTSLTGTLTVYYPGGEKYDKYWSGDNAIVPASQTGNFADANICKGSVDENGTNLTLNNQTAVFEVSVPSGTKQLTVTSLNPVSDGQRASSGAVNIADGSATITVGNNTADIPNPCYVSVLPGTVLLQDLNFDTGSAQGGFSPKYITSKGKTPSSYAVEVNTMYTLEAASLHEYVTVAGKKWATMNVGATSETDKGFYFAWGETTGHAAASNGENAFVSGFTDNSKGFSWSNCPLSDGSFDHNNHKNSFTKCTGSKNEYAKLGTADNKTFLDLEDDAAFWNWGGAWHMPEQNDFSSLINTTNTTTSNFLNNVLTIKDTSLQFPAGGYGEGTGVTMTSRGRYWSSSLSTDYPYAAYRFHFYSSKVNQVDDLTSRYIGSSVRPVSE